MISDREIEREIREKLALGKYRAGRALGWGRRATDAAVEAGHMPVIRGARPTVPTSWLRAQLRLTIEPKEGIVNLLELKNPTRKTTEEIDLTFVCDDTFEKMRDALIAAKAPIVVDDAGGLFVKSRDGDYWRLNNTARILCGLEPYLKFKRNGKLVAFPAKVGREFVRRALEGQWFKTKHQE